MATYTPNIGLCKPDRTDYVSVVEAISNNMDTIDSMFKSGTSENEQAWLINILSDTEKVYLVIGIYPDSNYAAFIGVLRYAGTQWVLYEIASKNSMNEAMTISLVISGSNLGFTFTGQSFLVSATLVHAIRMK